MSEIAARNDCSILYDPPLFVLPMMVFLPCAALGHSRHGGRRLSRSGLGRGFLRCAGGLLRDGRPRLLRGRGGGRGRGEDGRGDGALVAGRDRLRGQEGGCAGDDFDGCASALVVGLGGDGAAGHGRVDDLCGDELCGRGHDDGGFALVLLGLGLGAHGRGRRCAAGGGGCCWAGG